MGRNIFDKVQKGVSNGGKWIGHTAESGGKWIGHAAEDTFHWSTKSAGKVGNSVLDFGSEQVSKITGVFSSPTFLIVAGVVVVAIVVLR